MAKGKAAAAAGAMSAVQSNKALQRLLQDEELRENLRVAFTSAQKAYGRLSNGKAATKTFTDDKKFQREVQRSAEALRDATAAMREGPKRKRRRRRGIGKLLLLGIVGGIGALVASEDLRNKVLDLLFGAEEEFDYTSATTSSSSSEPTTGVPATSS